MLSQLHDSLPSRKAFVTEAFFRHSRADMSCIKRHTTYFISATKAWNHARRTIDVKRVSPEWCIRTALSGWSMSQAEHERKNYEQLSLLPYVDQRSNRFKCPICAGETRDFAKNHLLNVMSLRRLKEEHHSTWIPKEWLLLTYYYLQIMCISKRDYHTKTWKSRAKVSETWKSLDKTPTFMRYVSCNSYNWIR